MKSVIILIVILCSLLCCTFIFSQQSNITYDNGSVIDIQSGADVCADVITINGSYSGGGSICSGALPVTLSLFNSLSVKNNVKLYWKTEAETNNSGFVSNNLSCVAIDIQVLIWKEDLMEVTGLNWLSYQVQAQQTSRLNIITKTKNFCPGSIFTG